MVTTSLGRDFILTLKLKLNFGRRQMAWDGLEMPMRAHDEAGALRKLLLLFDDLNKRTIGTTHSEPFEFELKDSVQPYHARPFGIPQTYLSTVKKEIARLDRLGVIVRYICGPWAAPAFIVPKKHKTAAF
ncbi:hypothetical protein PR003_g4379 [Phytophthora rubi]|uniref:Reverse transcriptase domain-containing protein n=1 Tax=Phytophthora rubi TaxID=129364 RepID=A0A6A3NX01_9STRA|nr:hypothetical protein PR001_g4155 [Phytophthora rubi]KAE9352466.1 hypothetical protein PR003_g4379 [Phytophthora rubi]